MPADIASQIELWRGRLLDTSKRNRLVSFSTGRSGGIRLVQPAVGAIWGTLVATGGTMRFPLKRTLIDEIEADDDSTGDSRGEDRDSAERHDLDRCLVSPRLGPGDLLTELTDKQLAARLNRLALNARTSLSEMGVTTLYLAVGLLRWYESVDSAVALHSPLMLIPVRLARENVEAPWMLTLEDEEVISNHSLIQILDAGFGVRLPPVPEDLDLDDPDYRDRYYDQVRRCLRDLHRWEVLDVAALGIFSFQKIAMWQDLGANKDIFYAANSGTSPSI